MAPLMVGTSTWRGDGLRIITKIPRVAHDDAVAFTALDRGRDDSAAERGRNDFLYIADRKAITRGRLAVGRDLDIVSAAQPFGKGARRARDGFDDALDLGREPLKVMQIRAEHLDADRGADAGGEHIDACLDWHRPGVADAGKAQGLVHLRLQLFNRHAGAPVALGFEIDHGLRHLDRRRIGRGVGTARFAEDGIHFGKGFDDAVLGLQQLGGFGDRKAGSVTGI